jgi:hypothetical protein
MAACSAVPVAILRDVRKSALLRMRLMDDIDMLRTPETLYYSGFVPATPSVRARSEHNRGGRDKPSHDPGEMAGSSI